MDLSVEFLVGGMEWCEVVLIQLENLNEGVTGDLKSQNPYSKEVNYFFFLSFVIYEKCFLVRDEGDKPILYLVSRK